MHEQQPELQRQPLEAAPEQRPERLPEVLPQIYVADLAAYNAGRLHGRWLDANQDVGELEDAIAGVLATSPVPGAEEWAIHDYDGFAGLRLDEHESLQTISRLADGLAAHGPAFAALANWLGTEEASSENFENYYRGSWPQLEDYAEELLRDLGVYDLVEQLPGWALPYVQVDAAGFARDLRLGGDIYAVTDTSRGDQQVHVFDTHP